MKPFTLSLIAFAVLVLCGAIQAETVSATDGNNGVSIVDTDVVPAHTLRRCVSRINRVAASCRRRSNLIGMRCRSAVRLMIQTDHVEPARNLSKHCVGFILTSTRQCKRTIEHLRRRCVNDLRNANASVALFNQLDAACDSAVNSVDQSADSNNRSIQDLFNDTSPDVGPGGTGGNG